MHIQPTPFFGQMLVLAILAVTCLRVYFISKTRIDSLVLFAPLAFFITILQIFANGLTIASWLVLCLSFIVFFINWRGVIRFCNHLFVDTYSIAFLISSSFCLVFTIFLAVVLILNIPVTLNPKKYAVQKDKINFYKSDYGEFTKEAEHPFKNPDVIITTYSPDSKQKNYENDFVILFTPDKRAPKDAYEPYFILLAKAGFKVYAADFGFGTITSAEKVKIEPLLYQNLVFKSRKNSKTFFSQNTQYKTAYEKEYEMLSKIADNEEAHLKKFIIVGDGITAESFGQIKNPARTIYACISLNQIGEYKTSGFGFIEQSDPLLANIFFGLKKDKKCFVPSYAVLKTKQIIGALDDIK